MISNLITRDELRSQEIEMDIIRNQISHNVYPIMNEDGLILDDRFRMVDDALWVNEEVAQKWLSTAIILWLFQEEISRLCRLNETKAISDSKFRQEIQTVLNGRFIA